MSAQDPLQALDDALAEPGFWMSFAEEEETAAEHFARALDAEGWARLDGFWRERSLHWQRCLATVLTSIAPAQTVPWLLEMIERGHDDVAIHAIDELRAFHRVHALVLPWPPAALERVRRLWSQRRGFSPTQLEELVADMARGRLGG